MKHILTALDLDAKELEDLFERARLLKADPGHAARKLAGKRVVHLFYEPSTRTRLSFEAATNRLGGTYSSTENAAEFSSAAKGESLKDSIRVASGYADAIVLRHPDAGAAAQAARVSRVPVINAGDGGNEHPTQAFLDLFTIWEAVRKRGLPKKIAIVFLGDNAKSRTVRSLARLLARHGKALDLEIERLTFAGIGPSAHPPQDLLQEMERHLPCVTDVCMKASPDWSDANVLYVTRFQKERHTERRKAVKPFVFDAAHAAKLPERSIILHPLPRTEELSPDVDADPRAWYFEQARNGLFVRMALLEMLLAGKPAKK